MADDRTAGDAAIETDTGPGRRLEHSNRAGIGSKVFFRNLSIDTAFQRMTSLPKIRLSIRQWLA